MAAMDFRRARSVDSGDYWPGFVDALATLLLVVIFLLSLFALAQFVLGQAIEGRDAQLDNLRSEIADLSESLRLERTRSDTLESDLTSLRATLASEREASPALQGELDEARAHNLVMEAQLEGEAELTESARSEVALLNQQMAALNAQLAALNEALDAAEARDEEQQAQIENLSQRLNTALARRVQELARFRSEFFEAITNALGSRTDIRVVGDALLEIAAEIPDEIDWILRVDGHTDVRPIRTNYASNWELSAARALTVVHFFEDRGVPSNRLVAAGFGEHHPIAESDTEEAYAANRRIEIKLDSR